MVLSANPSAIQDEVEQGEVFVDERQSEHYAVVAVGKTALLSHAKTVSTTFHTRFSLGGIRLRTLNEPMTVLILHLNRVPNNSVSV